MSVPYSDNLYSALEDEDDDDYAQSSGQVDASAANQNAESSASNAAGAAAGTDGHDEDEALSPSDGYFRASDAVAYEPTPHRQSSNVPTVPNVLVEDPTLRDDERDTKTREAEHERRLSNMAALQQQAPSPPSQQSHTASSSRPRHSHRRSVEEDHDEHYHAEDIYDHPDQSAHRPSHARPQQQQQRQPPSRPNETSPLFQQQHFDAPPAYTPSPTTRSQPSQHDHTPSTPTSASSASAGYQTFGSPPTSAGPAMGVPSEHQRLLPNREPESMGGERGDDTPRTFWQRLRRAFSVRDGRLKLVRVLKWLLVVGIFVALISGITFSGKHHPPEPIKGPGDPATPPNDGTGPHPHPKPEPSNPDPAPNPRPPIQEPGESEKELTWKSRRYCREPENDVRVQIAWPATFTSSRSLTVIQKWIEADFDAQRHYQPNVEGEVVVRRAPESQSHASIKVEVLANHKDVHTNLDFNEDIQELLITTPNMVNWRYAGGPCLQMRVTVMAPPKSALENLILNTTQLNIDVVKDLDLAIEQEMHFSTISGNVNTPVKSTSVDGGVAKLDDPYGTSKRQTIIHTVSGDVKGWFALNDLLEVGTISGDITLEVDPKEVDPDSPEKAKLMLSSASGDISVNEPINGGEKHDVNTFSDEKKKKFPGRDYYVDISTSSGEVSGSFAFSSYANVRSQSGDLTLTFWPVLDPEDKGTVTLGTNTKSGDMVVTVLEPWWTGLIKPQDQRLEGPKKGDGEQGEKDPKKGDEPWIIIHPHDILPADPTISKRSTTNDNKDRPLGNLIAKHGTISGDIRLRYPASWEGSLVAETISGSQHVRGEGLTVYDVGTPLMKTWTGRKGNGASDLKVVTVSGSENILVGREPK